MVRRTTSSIFSFLGLAAFSLGISSWIGLNTVLDSDNVTNTATNVLADPVVKAKVVKAIESRLPDIEQLVAGSNTLPQNRPNSNSKSPTSTIPAAQAQAISSQLISQRELIVNKAYDDPRTKQVLTSALHDIHRYVVKGDQNRLDLIDTAPLQATLIDAARQDYATLAPYLVLQETKLDLNVSSIPRLGIYSKTKLINTLSFALAALFLSAAYLFHPHRHKLVARIGRYLVVNGSLWIVGLVYLPRLLVDHWDNAGTIRIVALVIRSMGAQIVSPARFVVVTGLALMFGAYVWKRLKRDITRGTKSKPHRDTANSSVMPRPMPHVSSLGNYTQDASPDPHCSSPGTYTQVRLSNPAAVSDANMQTDSFVASAPIPDCTLPPLTYEVKQHLPPPVVYPSDLNSPDQLNHDAYYDQPQQLVEPYVDKVDADLSSANGPSDLSHTSVEEASFLDSRRYDAPKHAADS